MADRNTDGGKGGPGINGKPGGSNRNSASPGVSRPGGGPGDSAENGKSAGPDKRDNSGNAVPADERMVLIHGFSREETIAVMRAAKTAVSDPQGVAFTTSTPTNLDWKLRDLIVEVREEHEYMRWNPPGSSGQQQNPPGANQAGQADQAGDAARPGQPHPQASNQKGGPEETGPSAPEKDR